VLPRPATDANACADRATCLTDSSAYSITSGCGHTPAPVVTRIPCEQRRHELYVQATTQEDLDVRTNLLRSMPTCADGQMIEVGAPEASATANSDRFAQTGWVVADAIGRCVASRGRSGLRHRLEWDDELERSRTQQFGLARRVSRDQRGWFARTQRDRALQLVLQRRAERVCVPRRRLQIREAGQQHVRAGWAWRLGDLGRYEQTASLASDWRSTRCSRRRPRSGWRSWATSDTSAWPGRVRSWCTLESVWGSGTDANANACASVCPCAGDARRVGRADRRRGRR